MAEQENQSSFPDARMLSEGFFTTAQGCLVNTTYVDLSGTLSLDGLGLAKATEPQFELSTTKSIRLSRPSVFRSTGEVLVRDEQEGLARRDSRQTVARVETNSPQTERRVAALNASLRLGDAKVSVNSTEKSEDWKSRSEWMTFGNDWLIYCTSILPLEREEAWRRTFPASYTSVSRIHRPMQFAQALGVGVCEHIGATGKPAPLRGTFHGFRTMESQQTPQLVVHGPVLYVDDPYLCIAETEMGWARICSTIFVKSREYEAQREYRFAMLSIRAEVGDVFDLPMSGMLRDCLEPLKIPTDAVSSAVKMSNDDSEVANPRETFRGYTYRRRKVTRESTGRGSDETGSTNEVVVEETVTSPDEVPDPFPSDEKPDVILVHQMGGQLRYVHNAYRDEEKFHWRIETFPATPAIIEDPGSLGLPKALDVPPELRLDPREEIPVHPGYILDLCLNPSVPRPPRRYEGLERLSPTDLDHVLACHQALDSAVEQVPDALRERAAASAWYAFLFVVEITSLFGPVVESVCVIEECVAVVELERAPFSGAVAWATFSGAGTYTLHVRERAVEEMTYAGQSQRASPMMQSTYVKALEDHGWGSKRERTSEPRHRRS